MQSLIRFLAYVGSILSFLHLSGIIKFSSYELKIQTEECLKLGGKDVELVDRLPWEKKSKVLASDYKSMMLNLKNRAPRNGRAVYLFRNDLFGPFVSKLEAWN